MKAKSKGVRLPSACFFLPDLMGSDKTPLLATSTQMSPVLWFTSGFGRPSSLGATERDLGLFCNGSLLEIGFSLTSEVKVLVTVRCGIMQTSGATGKHNKIKPLHNQNLVFHRLAIAWIRHLFPPTVRTMNYFSQQSKSWWFFS